MNLFDSKLHEKRIGNNFSTFYLLCITTSLFWAIYFELNFTLQNSSKIIFGLCIVTCLLWIVGKLTEFPKLLLNLNISLLLAAVVYTSLELGGGINVATTFLIAIPMTSLLLLNIKELFIWNIITFIVGIFLIYTDLHNFQKIVIEDHYFELYALSVFSLFIIFFVVMYANYNQRLNTILGIEEQKINATRNTNLAAIGRIAGGLAQEIKSPITIINGNISSIRKKLNSEDIDDSNKFKSLDTILKTTERILKIIHSLEELAVGDHELELSVMRVDFAMKAIENEVQSFATDKLEIFVVNHDSEESSFYLNETSFFQIIINLISNASDAVSEFDKSWIRIESFSEKKYISFRITDSGRGIDPLTVEKIFSPFYTTKELGKGTGLGLSLSLSLAKKMKGQLFYNSKEPNTQFQLVMRRA